MGAYYLGDGDSPDEEWYWKPARHTIGKLMSHCMSRECYKFGSFNGVNCELPYLYLAPRKDLKTKELVYPRKIIGICKFSLKIPLDKLVRISNFELKYYNR